MQEAPNEKDWRSCPYFKSARMNPESFINFDETMFRYLNLNPKGRIGQNDQVFQILRHFRQDMTNEDIMQAITDEQIAHAVMSLDGGSAARIFKKHLGFPYKKLEERVTLEDFLQGKEAAEAGIIVLRLVEQVELCDANERKILGCHPVQRKQRVSGYWRRP